MATKLELRRDSYLTDGKRLVQVLRVTKEMVVVEDALDGHQFPLKHSEVGAGTWRNVESEPADA